MCGGGGGGAAARAEREEKNRQIQVRGATNAIDTAFAGRSGQLADFVSALREQFGAEAGRQKKVADRSLKFSLARGGLTGGSADADLGAELGDEFQRGILKGERMSQSALSDLKSADEAVVRVWLGSHRAALALPVLRRTQRTHLAQISTQQNQPVPLRDLATFSGIRLTYSKLKKKLRNVVVVFGRAKYSLLHLVGHRPCVNQQLPQ